jgi:hypothetical protein
MEKLKKFNIFQIKFGLFKSTNNRCDIVATYVFTNDEPKLIDSLQLQQFNNTNVSNSISQSYDNLTTLQQTKQITLFSSYTPLIIYPPLSISYQNNHIQHAKRTQTFQSDSKERYFFFIITYYF